MKALILCGGKRGGFTSVMCEMFSSGLISENIESSVMHPLEMNIGHCDGCGKCSDGKCVIDDDMDIIYKAFGESDLLVLSSPIRFSGPSSIIKTVMDRFQVCWYNEGKRPSYFAALLNGGMERPRFENVISSFKAFSITIDMEWLGELTISKTDSLDIDDVRNPSTAFGKDIAAKIRNRL